ncbi:hypothetical protein HK104_008260 [Borealophlyctis nickersoniae]|nr:hypothetical protein HK104_008260 [Borealophlyctis nickersoniae]
MPSRIEPSKTTISRSKLPDRTSSLPADSTPATESESSESAQFVLKHRTPRRPQSPIHPPSESPNTSSPVSDTPDEGAADKPPRDVPAEKEAPKDGAEEKKVPKKSRDLGSREKGHMLMVVAVLFALLCALAVGTTAVDETTQGGKARYGRTDQRPQEDSWFEAYEWANGRW